LIRLKREKEEKRILVIALAESRLDRGTNNERKEKGRQSGKENLSTRRERLENDRTRKRRTFVSRGRGESKRERGAQKERGATSVPHGGQDDPKNRLRLVCRFKPDGTGEGEAFGKKVCGIKKPRLLGGSLPWVHLKKGHITRKGVPLKSKNRKKKKKTREDFFLGQ